MTALLQTVLPSSTTVCIMSDIVLTICFGLVIMLLYGCVISVLLMFLNIFLLCIFLLQVYVCMCVLLCMGHGA